MASAKRGELAKAVMGEIAPEMRDVDPNAFKKAIRTYSMHLTRLSKGRALWPFIDETNDNGEPVTFRNLKNGGCRAAKPNHRRNLLDIEFIDESRQNLKPMQQEPTIHVESL